MEAMGSLMTAHLCLPTGVVIAGDCHAVSRHSVDRMDHLLEVRATPVRRIRVLAPPSLPRSAAHAPYLRTIAKLVGAVDYHTIAHRQSSHHRNAPATCGSKRHRPHSYCVVRLNRIHVCSWSAPLNCGRRYHYSLACLIYL